jgi:hypothetical protein
MRPARVRLLWLASFSLLASPATAQVSVATSLSLATPYVFRGVTRANAASLQPEAFLALGIGHGFLTAGGWANFELGEPSPGNLSDLGGDRPGFSEVDYWVQYTGKVGALQGMFGAIRYTFPGDAPAAVRTSDDNTTELYAGFQLTSTYIVPRLTTYLDIEHIGGAYLEGILTVPLLAYPFGNPVVFYANALAGLNLGQDQNPDRPDQGANFLHDGFTHVDLSLRATINLGKAVPIAINLEPHWQFKVDEFTRRTSPEPGDAERRTQFWLAMSMSTHFTLIPGRRP